MAERRHRLSRDPLGLSRALRGGFLPAVAAMMALLAALAVAGAGAAGAAAERWRGGAAAAVTVLLAAGDSAATERAAAAIARLPEIAQARAVDRERLAALLRPWLGEAPALPLPGVIELRLRAAPEPGLAQRIAAAAPGATLEAEGLWVARLVGFAEALRLAALASLALVAAAATAVVALATRAAIAARRDAIALLHELGATRGAIAGRFGARLGLLVLAGAALGTGLAVPALLALGAAGEGALPAVPGLPWLALLAIPPAAGALAWAAAQATVRRALRGLP